MASNQTEQIKDIKNAQCELCEKIKVNIHDFTDELKHSETFLHLFSFKTPIFILIFH
jgi:hypothetical protein